MNVGILHPGEMGSSLGAALVATGHCVHWVQAGRSAATVQRAQDAGLQGVESLAELLEKVEVLLSICPPHAALDQARAVIECGFGGIYVDANAVAPGTARSIESTVSAAADFVDGGVIGPPARQPGTTRLYLCGARAEEVAALFGGSVVEAMTLEGSPGAASALKMCYAAWTKGSAALLMAVAGLARHAGVEGELRGEWRLSLPELEAQLERVALSNAPKAWRFTGEMEEIAATFRRARMPDGFHLAAAEIYSRVSELKDQEPLDTDTIFDLLIAQ
jgi:3-hydroxyisobutyrate dehydrogenase-like beta-hydroxyacid dehydrogenase